MWEPTIHTQRNTHTLKCAHAHIYKQYLWVVLFGQISFVCMCQQCVWVCVLTANGASVSLVLYNTVHVKMKLSALVLQVCLHFQCAGKHICWCHTHVQTVQVFCVISGRKVKSTLTVWWPLHCLVPWGDRLCTVQVCRMDARREGSVCGEQLYHKYWNYNKRLE